MSRRPPAIVGVGPLRLALPITTLSVAIFVAISAATFLASFDPPPATAAVPASSPAGRDVGGASVAAPTQVALTIGRPRSFGGIAPPGWRDVGFDDRAWSSGAGLIVPRTAFAPSAAAPSGVTVVDLSPGGSLYWRAPFDVTTPEVVRSLELRVAYQDGFIAYLNGRELARRNVPEAPQTAHPLVPHGRDPERIFIPVPAQGGARSLRSKGNVLSIEFRPAAGRAPLDANAPSAEVALAAFAGVRIVRGPYLVAPAEGAVSVAWETDLVARGRVFFQPEDARAGLARQAQAARPGLRQVVRLPDLTPGARYRYRVEVEGGGATGHAQSSPASFQTAPRRDQPLRFIVYGDMRAPGHAAHAQVVAALMHEQPALVVNTGDLVAVGSEESAWQRYFEITAPLGAIAPVAPALGNHEAYLGGGPKSWDLFGLRTAASDPASGYTSFDWGGAHFVILDSNHPDVAQRDWLVSDLVGAARRRSRAIFVFCHDGPWSHGTHGGSRTMERQFASALAAGGTDVLFAGHDHLYERGTGVTSRGPLPYVVTGGGGAPLYNPTCQPSSPPPLAPASSRTASTTLASEPPPPGLPTCPPSVANIQKAYHYVVVEVDDRRVRICPRLPDRTALEPCVELPLRQRSR